MSVYSPTKYTTVIHLCPFEQNDKSALGTVQATLKGKQNGKMGDKLKAYQALIELIGDTLECPERVSPDEKENVAHACFELDSLWSVTDFQLELVFSGAGAASTE